MEISAVKKQFLESLGLDLNDLPEEFNRVAKSYSFSLTKEEQDFLFSDRYTKEFILPFSMKDIVGTKHPDYEDKPFLEVFIKTARGDENIIKCNNNPSYYEITLKQPDQSFKTALHDTPIELNRDSEGKCYIIGGNNRLSILMIKYLTELSKCKTDEEKEVLNSKYTFYAEIRSLPKNKEVYNIIFLLKNFFKDSIIFSFKGLNPDDCHYEVYLNDKVLEIKSIDQLKLLLFEAYNLSNSNTSEVLHDKLSSLIATYINERNNETKMKLLLEMCPNIEVIKDRFITLRSLNFSTSVFEGLDLTKINYSNIEDILNDLIFKENQKVETRPKI